MWQQFDRIFNEALLHKNESNIIDDRYRNVFETMSRLTVKEKLVIKSTVFCCVERLI